MLQTRTFVLLMLALFLCTATAMAGEEQESENGKTTVRSLVAAAGEGLYKGTRFTAKEVLCDGTRAGYDGLKWFADQTPADHGRNAWTGIRKTPGQLWRGTKWGLGHLW